MEDTLGAEAKGEDFNSTKRTQSINKKIGIVGREPPAIARRVFEAGRVSIT